MLTLLSLVRDFLSRDSAMCSFFLRDPAVIPSLSRGHQPLCGICLASFSCNVELVQSHSFVTQSLPHVI